MYYILKGMKVIEESDVKKWAKFFETDERLLARSRVLDCEVSTVFLGLDHSFRGKKPIVFETMVFGGKLDGEQERYATYKEASIGHSEMVLRVKKGNK